MKLIFTLLTFISVDSPSMILIAGGSARDHSGGTNALASVEVISQDASNKAQLPNLPETIYSSLMVKHNGDILLCGGNSNYQQCLKMEKNGWTPHSNLIKKRKLASAVATNTATFIFGGAKSKTTYEYLEQGSSSNWQEGNERIPGIGFYSGCAIGISDEQVWLIGGAYTESRILSFNTRSHKFTEVTSVKLKEGRYDQTCVQIPRTTKIMVSGGRDSFGNVLDSTEVIDFVSMSVKSTGNMNFKRSRHGIGILTLNGRVLGLPSFLVYPHL